ncbi:MAG: hypothetical protein Q4D96_13995 [Propionibacteriaceae bacterium]|nr:hypothetical protein [Propionibacteriaceae bacterium]
MNGDVQALAVDIKRLMDRLSRDFQEDSAYWQGVRDTWPDDEVHDAGRAIKVINRRIGTLVKNALSLQETCSALAEMAKVLADRVDSLTSEVERLSE